MKAFTSCFYKAFLLSLFLTAITLPGQSQVLVQDFDNLQQLNEFQNRPPSENQVDTINLNPTNSGPVFSLGKDGANQYLQIDKRATAMRHFDRTTGLDDEDFLRISFDFSVISADSTNKFGAIFIGDNLYRTSSHPIREERFAQVVIHINKNGSFYLTNEVILTNGNTIVDGTTSSFTGEKRITIFVNNNDEENSLIYNGPEGKSGDTELKVGAVHIWVGNNLLVGTATKGASSSISAVKFLLWNNGLTASARMDNLSITKDIEVDPLPIDLLSFSVKSEGKDILLGWETASELNSSHFEVERSLDGNIFTTIGRVKAAGDSKSNLAYAFTDKYAAQNFGGIVYYRLHLIDIDGSSDYSPVEQIVLPGFGSATQKVFPNPFKDKLEVKLLTDKALQVKFRLLTVQGNVVIEDRQLFSPSGQEQVYMLPGTGKLEAGIYMLEISNGEEIRMQRIVKL